MLIRYFNAEIQIVSLVNFTLLSQRSFVPSLASVTKSAVVTHFLSLREPTKCIFICAILFIMRKEDKVHKSIICTLFMVYGAIFDVDMKVQ